MGDPLQETETGTVVMVGHFQEMDMGLGPTETIPVTDITAIEAKATHRLIPVGRNRGVMAGTKADNGTITIAITVLKTTLSEAFSSVETMMEITA